MCISFVWLLLCLYLLYAIILLKEFSVNYIHWDQKFGIIKIVHVSEESLAHQGCIYYSKYSKNCIIVTQLQFKSMVPPVIHFKM